MGKSKMSKQSIKEARQKFHDLIVKLSDAAPPNLLSSEEQEVCKALLVFFGGKVDEQ